MTKSDLKLMSDCSDRLGLTVRELLSIAWTAPKRYFVWKIPKRSGGGVRTVCHPARELKAIQGYFLSDVIYRLPVHESATAYVKEKSIKLNAKRHVKSRVIMKVDFVDFFNSIRVENWDTFAKQYFKEWSSQEREFARRVLFWGGGGYAPYCLAIGAPTSPLVSNAIVYEIDKVLQAYAEAAGLTYTRYADDIAFSSEGWMDYDGALNKIKETLVKARFSDLRINENKTVLVSNASLRMITGLVITPDRRVSLGRDRKRLISAMVHHVCRGSLPPQEMPRLAGLLAFANDIEPAFIISLQKKYSAEVVQRIIQHGTRLG